MGKRVGPWKRQVRTAHWMDPVSHWAIEDNKDYHDFGPGPDGALKYSKNTWSKAQKKE